MRFLIMILFCAAFTAMPAADARAVERIPPDRAREIFDIASELSGYPLPPTLPEILVIPHKIFLGKFCDGGYPCYRALAEPRMPIFVDDSADINDPDDFSFYVHEAVHMLQYDTKRIGDLETISCEDALTLEREAYTLQQRFLRKNGRFLDVTLPLRFMSCPSERGTASGPTMIPR